ncbi:pal1-like protein [Ophiocordyceps camponoti-floridani]|uniref:Pal1-like protein n=1 Tax=Ophiocordyceps camponoti-floridani TaxID=2030778 RepID=A0A8H4Q3F9_9HYPO|nr:pal1-like protein [Ophiocordyceps camponoti-floridani]
MTASLKDFRQCFSSRTIRVLVSPTPVTFTERRAVLQVLEKHGAIQMFRMTPDYYANFVSVTRDEETVDRLVSSCPIGYQIREDGIVKREDKDKGFVSDFFLNIFPEPDYRHDYTEAREPTRHPWPPMWQKDQSLMATTLQQSLPSTLAARGLAHWFLRFDEAPTQYKAWRLALASWLPSKMREDSHLPI